MCQMRAQIQETSTQDLRMGWASTLSRGRSADAEPSAACQRGC